MPKIVRHFESLAIFWRFWEAAHFGGNSMSRFCTAAICKTLFFWRMRRHACFQGMVKARNTDSTAGNSTDRSHVCPSPSNALNYTRLGESQPSLFTGIPGNGRLRPVSGVFPEFWSSNFFQKVPRPLLGVSLSKSSKCYAGSNLTSAVTVHSHPNESAIPLPDTSATRTHNPKQM